MAESLAGEADLLRRGMADLEHKHQRQGSAPPRTTSA
jgi:hypothetical protein